ncbi:dynamin-related protein DRPB [Cardiosporidium cionae]|uniref:Dynamin-related protein DRPB n=1 Tax=Cardiosporidium cionae TaxID=476202 RepID=A0ABQ7J5Q0_9APIC|nr:dynamin-related protein DRPB [Cardiosporidium cionae]|eukprot:KAF8819331.1 dynamin-related protein DRPB [Cardiosporidium cionae]
MGFTGSFSSASYYDELRDVGLHQYINLPRVCVVGTQSSGKSSVLESIIGLDFLPRGEGIVTRIPLELRLTHVASQKGECMKPYALFEKDTKHYTDFVTVKEKIEALTDEVADLTLIDLPGITRVPLRGSDQTDDIEKLTREMARRYVSDPRTIILAVIAANADMSTSDALQLARIVDPKGLRTIGVITKIDLMDRGTDAVKMLLGEDIPLRLGYTGVINRSQASIVSKKPISEALEEEKAFFQNNPLYRTLSSSVLGVHSLVLKVTRVLFRHIRHLLPDIKSEIDSKRRVISLRLHELGDGVPSDASSRAKILWSMITDYCDIVRSLVRGRYVRKLQAFFEQSELVSGAHIRLIFNNLMSHLVQKNCTADMTDADVDTAIQMHEGDSLPGFPSPDTFEYLIRPHLMKIQTPAHDCLEQVHQFLEDICGRVANRVFCRFPKLSEKREVF